MQKNISEPWIANGPVAGLDLKTSSGERDVRPPDTFQQALPARDNVDRIVSLDVLRGVAVLGILLMNIQAFSMISAAYINPTAYGDLHGLNLSVWLISHLFADQKFISIFSMLFGAGILIMSKKGISVRRIHYRRMIWLMLFGLLHAYLLWYGDILFTYAICGMIVFVFRNSSPRKQITWALIFLSIPFIISMSLGLSMSSWSAEAIQSLDNEGWRPLSEAVAAENAAYRSGWLAQMPYRSGESFFFQTLLLLTMIGWKASALMLIGMAFYQMGVLTGEKTSESYRRLMVIGFVSGFSLILFGIYENFQHGWDVRYSFFLGGMFNYWGSVPVAFGWLGLVMLMVKSSCCRSLTQMFASVGRMAFTNYILQTLICTTIFYGHGLGVFGYISRFGQFMITIAIWVILMVISPLWLKKFRYGPLEWLWRSLTYGKNQPFLQLNS